MKFSELTLDMFRMLQLLEREPTSADKQNSDNNEQEKKDNQEDPNDKNEKNSMRRINPHKYLLHKPSFGQLMLYITTAFKVLQKYNNSNNDFFKDMIYINII